MNAPIEDSWKEITPEVIPEVTPEVTPEVEKPKADFSEIDALIEDIKKWSKKEEIPTEPKEFIKKDGEENPKEEEKGKEKEPSENLSEEELLELENSFKDLEKELEGKETEIAEINTLLTDANTLSTAYEEAIKKLWDHPILWPLNTKIIKWEEVDIPAFLKKGVNDDIDSIPKTEKIKSLWKTPNPWKLTFQEKVFQSSKQLY